MRKNLLRAALAEKGFTQKEFAKIIGMSENSLSRKINGRREFTVTEAATICSILDLSAPVDIFFTPDIPNMQRIGDKPKKQWIK